MAHNRVTDEQLAGLITEALKTSVGYDNVIDLCRKAGARFSNTRFCRIYNSALSGLDGEIIVENVRLAGQVQKQQDLNRIKNKSFREHARIANAMSECNSVVVELLQRLDFDAITIQHKETKGRAMGLIHLSDMHLNELVSTQVNHFDFEVASRRLRKLAIRAKAFLKSQCVTSVLVANTGDILNSDRRLDEYLSQATNRMNAMMLAVFLIEQFLVDLNQDFSVSYAQVSGNESRVKDEPGFVDMVLSDNYDSAIFNVLKYGMKSAKGITFLDGDISEKVVNVGGRNVLITHGEQFSNNNTVRDVQGIKGKYAQYGITIDFVVFGHIHSAYVHDLFARGSSLVGPNAYSDRGLQIAGRASQNVHVFHVDGSRDSLVIDLDKTEDVKGYDIIEELASYNAKSEKKLHHQTVIHEIVI